MTEKVLGKIDFAEFGTVSDYPFLIGLQLGFSLNGGVMGIMSGSEYTVNISPTCRWEKSEREEVVTKYVENLWELLKTAKCNYVSDLIGKPVEVVIENNTFKDFRILTEVL
jgi:hypothetical protein